MIQPLLSGQIEISIELPIGREVTASAQVCHVIEEPSGVYIGLSFNAFRYRDEAGWLAFMASKQREHDAANAALHAQTA